MQQFKERTVAEIVTQNIKASDVFKKYGIDFCCGGDISVEEACKIKGLKVNSIRKRRLAKHFHLTRGVKKFDTWSFRCIN